MGEEYHCRVCGLFQGGRLREPDETSESLDNPEGTSLHFLYEICLCCGTRFGVEDDGATEADALFFVRQRRQAWLEAGAKWILLRRKPDDWDLETQLKQIPDGWE